MSVLTSSTGNYIFLSNLVASKNCCWLKIQVIQFIFFPRRQGNQGNAVSEPQNLSQSNRWAAGEQMRNFSGEHLVNNWKKEQINPYTDLPEKCLDIKNMILFDMTMFLSKIFALVNFNSDNSYWSLLWRLFNSKWPLEFHVKTLHFNT